ncbi:MAG TPA: 50S ribosomal protein L15 [Candidatus Egerieicola faecale]|jgi:ribosomal protein L15|uniref:Large ribosomal subunit protein uL15 n=1 Tax=Candidatus Egerieicola faecale TaxID=2840774 RepID=A0A9D1IS61_9FIRM|nr:50S ribosomal protein L15 [Candidatus Egerieicola faecale]
MKLHELTPAEGSTKVAKRIGRGHGSGNGKTAGKGHKGQKARSGGSIRPGFEGGQMPLQRRVPKRGFNNIFAAKAAIVNLGDIDARFEAGAVVDAQALMDCGLVKDCKNGVKVLGNGEMTKSLTIQAKSFSKSAQDKIEGAGGKAEVI